MGLAHILNEKQVDPETLKAEANALSKLSTEHIGEESW